MARSQLTKVNNNSHIMRRMSKRPARIMLMLVLAVGMLVQGFAIASRYCGAEAHHDAAAVALDHGSHAAGQAGDPAEQHAHLFPGAHCVVVDALLQPVAAFAAERLSQAAVATSVAFPPDFVPDGSHRPPLTRLA